MSTKINTVNRYLILNERQQEESNAFPFFFAFGEQQFNDAMRKVGLDPATDLDKIYSLGAGIYLKKEDAPALRAMQARHKKELAEAMSNRAFVVDAFAYQLANHECILTGEVEPACYALGLTLDAVYENPTLLEDLRAAIKRVRGEAI